VHDSLTLILEQILEVVPDEYVGVVRTDVVLVDYDLNDVLTLALVLMLLKVAYISVKKVV